MKLKKEPTANELHEFLQKKFGVDVSEKLLRYHLNRLIVSGILRRSKAKYCINHSPEGERNNLQSSFQHWVKKPVVTNMERIESVISKLEKTYKS